MSASQETDPAAGPQLHDPMMGLLCHELRRTTAAVVTAMTQEFAKLGLKPTEATLLVYIGANPNCTQSDIARAYRNKATNLVPLIARLQCEDLLVRAPGGGRAIALTLSEKGLAALVEVKACLGRIEAGISRQLTEPGRATLIEALGRVSHDACHYQRRPG